MIYSAILRLHIKHNTDYLYCVGAFTEYPYLT